MKLISMTLENFQGIKNLPLQLNGGNASIYGDNGAGKTTVYNAMTWLLFGKSSTGAASFSPKTKDENGDDVHYLDHSVEAAFQGNLGAIHTLKRVRRENYKKRRGSVVEEFDGHLVDYYVDGVPVKEREFKTSVQEMIGTELQMQALMMPDYFPETMKWQDRRQLLLEVCGDITDEDLIETTPALFELKHRLLMPGSTDQYYTVEMYRKVTTASMTEINNQLKTIPARIDEAKKAQPDIRELDSEENLTAQLKELAKTREAKEKTILQLQSTDQDAAAIRAKIADVQAEMAEARAAYVESVGQANGKAHERIRELQGEIGQLTDEIAAENRECDRLKREHDRLLEMRERIQQEYARKYSEVWSGDEVCTTCQRALPAEEIEKARSEFNLNRSNALMEIEARGKRECGKEQVAQLEETHAAAVERKAEKDARLAALDAEVNTIRGRIVTPPPFEHTLEYGEFQKRIDALQNTKDRTGTEAAKSIEEIRLQITQLTEKSQNVQRDLAQRVLYDQQASRIQELKAQEKHLAKDYENLQAGINLCDLFVKTKVNALEQHINSRFQSVRFRLFEVQINGGLKEGCEVMVPSENGQLVPYSVANNAARINAGLEIIDTLSEYWGASMPVFVDNAEAVTRLKKIRPQVIRLVVSEADRQLRVELEDANEAQAAG